MQDSALALVIVAATVALVFGIRYAQRKAAEAKPTHVCKNCHSAIIPTSVTTRNGVVTFLLFWFFIIPAVIYVMVSKNKMVCPNCKAEHPVPMNTPAAQALLAA